MADTGGSTTDPVAEPDTGQDKPALSVESPRHARHLVLLFVIAFVTVAVLVAMMLLHP